MKDHGISINRHCPCQQEQCPILGNCVLCVQNHLTHKRHVPECIQELLRPAIQSLAKQMELKIEDDRHEPGYWDTVDKNDFVKRSMERHKSGEDR